jgi:hypothetical protein
MRRPWCARSQRFRQAAVTLWLQKEMLDVRGVLAGACLGAPGERLEPGLKQDLDVLPSHLPSYPEAEEARP